LQADADASGGLRRAYREEIARLGFAPDAAQRAAVEHLERLRRELVIRDTRGRSLRARLLERVAPGSHPRAAPQGVYLWGAVGRGKTWLMDLFQRELPPGTGRRQHFHRFMREVHAGLRRHRQEPDPLARVAAELAGPHRILCLDELFVSDIADAMILGKLFHHLSSIGVSLVLTSNVPPRGLYREGLQRQQFMPAIELLEQRTTVVPLDGAIDYRLRQLQQVAIYLSSHRPETAAQLAEIFEDLADGPGQAEGSVEIEGRAIPFVRESDNVIWFTFAALCEGPRSQNDYIQIAREYQSVIVADVPVLGSAQDNSARRLIALVDEFYDRAVNLIVSAAAPIEQLYVGKRLAFEFERTRSRLVEMQSEDYLAREHRP